MQPIVKIVRRFRPARAAQHFIHCQDGIAAIEFGLVAVPFITLLLAIVETAIVLFAGQTLDTAVVNSSRLIMTGQAQTQGLNASTFKNAVCARVYGLFDCQNGIYVDVRTFTSFASATIPSPVDAQGNLQNNFSYQPGGPGDIVVVRLFYQFPVYLSMPGFNLANLNGGTRLLAASVAFRNEPYSN